MTTATRSETGAAAPTRGLRVAFVGDVDHGKSTLLGRILLDTGAVTSDRLATSIAAGGLAFLLDGLSEEQQGLFTLDTVSTVVETNGRRLTLVDVPGHFDLLRNMVTGASSADIGAVVVDCTQGVTEQTRRHTRILELLGISVVVCAVTKLDLVGHRRQDYESVAAGLTALAADCGVEIAAVVPVSALDGTNVLTHVPPGHALSWYAGGSLVETLYTVRERHTRSERVRFAVQSVLDRQGARLLVGRVESGLLRSGTQLHEQRTGTACRVLSIERYHGAARLVAGPGESVGLWIEGAAPPAGVIVAPPDQPPSFGTLWHARVLNITDREITAGLGCRVRFASCEVTGDVVAVDRRWDSASLAEVHDPAGVRFSEIGSVQIRLATATSADPLRVCPPTGRFMLCDRRGEAVALGVIDRITPEQPAEGSDA